MTRTQRFFHKAAVLAVTLLLTIYVGFRISYINLSPWIAPFAILLFLAETHMILHLYGMGCFIRCSRAIIRNSTR